MTMPRLPFVLTSLWCAGLGAVSSALGQVPFQRILDAESDPANWLTYAGKVTPNVPRNTFSFWNRYDVSSFFDAAPGLDDSVLARLEAMVGQRTRLYAWAWRLAIAGGLGFALLVALATLH